MLVFSDLHAHDWTLFGGVTQYRGHTINARLADAAKVIDWVGRKAAKHSVTSVLFLGDLFHKKRLIDVCVFSVVAEALYRLAEAFPVVVLAGNHDLTRRSAEGQFSDEHALAALGGHPRIQVVDQPTLVGPLGMVPYAADRDTLLRGVETCLAAGATALALHAGVAGAVTGPVEYQPFEPVSTEDLPDVPIVSGHYHLPQVVGRKVTYVGAPLELVRGDGGRGTDRRGAVLLDDEGRICKRLRYRGPQFLSCQGEPDEAAVAGHFIDVAVSSAVEAERLVEAYTRAGARAVNPVFVDTTPAKAARLKVPVNANGLPSVEMLCAQLVEHAETRFDRHLLTSIAQEALHAADTQCQR